MVLVNNKLVTIFLADIFNGDVSEKSQPISYLPSTQTFETIIRLNTVDAYSNKILNLIQCLNFNKVHSYGEISLRMLKIWRPSMVHQKTHSVNTYLILFIVFLIGFIVFLIGFIYYCRRSNFDRKKLRDFIYPKVKTSIY